VQAKDIPELPILKFIDSFDGAWCNWFSQDVRSVRRAMPEDTYPKVVLAKMRALIKKGLVDGCPCGCRGDFRLTDKGREYLKQTNSNELKE